MAKAVLPNGRPAKKVKLAHTASKPKSSSTSKKAASAAVPGVRSDSDEDDAQDNGNGADKSSALAALEAHSRMMLGLMGGADPDDDMEEAEEAGAESSAMAARRQAKILKRRAEHSDGSDDEDEDEDDSAEADDNDAEGFSSDDGWGAEDGMVTDSEEEGLMAIPKRKDKGKSKAAAVPTAISTPSIVVPEVVFADMGSSIRRDEGMTKAERKAFMSGKSSKIMGIAPEHVQTTRKRPQSSAEDMEDATNSSLDTTLHKMLLQNLLPSASADNASRPVDKRNAISGRLLELAQISLPGQGTSSLPSALHSRHSAKIRTGIIHAQAKRDEKARSASEAAGSWVRGKGGLGDIGKRGKGVGGVKGKGDRLGLGEVVKKKGMGSSKKAGAARERGLDASVGKFERGSLRVDERTIKRVEKMSEKRGPVLPKGKGKGGQGKGKGKSGW